MSLLRFLPLRLLSFLCGVLTRISWPRTLARFMMRVFVCQYRVDLTEATKPLSDYQSLEEFFTRDLKPELRPIGKGVVSPVDGEITQFGDIEAGRLLQVKGVHYTLSQLLGDQDLASYFEQGYFITFYLAPHNYHHIHAPLAGEVTSLIYIPGNLFPVNKSAVASIPQLFAINERVISIMQTALGQVAVVKVGALNVGSISLSYHQLRSNPKETLFCSTREMIKPVLPQPVSVKKGERLGTFHFGSTVVLLLPRTQKNSRIQAGPVKFGETIFAEPFA